MDFDDRGHLLLQGFRSLLLETKSEGCRSVFTCSACQYAGTWTSGCESVRLKAPANSGPHVDATLQGMLSIPICNWQFHSRSDCMPLLDAIWHSSTWMVCMSFSMNAVMHGRNHLHHQPYLDMVRSSWKSAQGEHLIGSVGWEWCRSRCATCCWQQTNSTACR